MHLLEEHRGRKRTGNEKWEQCGASVILRENGPNALNLVLYTR